MIARLLTLSFSILLLSSVALAEIRDDLRACEQNYFKILRKTLTPSASAANEQYCIALAYWFQTPQGPLPRDPVKSAKWFRLAADQGHTGAMVALGYQYEKGYGVPQDFKEAYTHYQLAADRGDPMGMFNLSRIYSTGRGVEKNDALSLEWRQKAEQAGSIDARVDRRKSEQYSSEAPGREIYAKGYEAFKSKNYQEAITFFTAAAAQGNPSAQVALGQLYRQGLGVEKNFQKATEHYRAAAEKGHARGAAQLGLSFELGEGVSEDWGQALYWFKKSAEKLDPLGLLCLGRMFQFGMSVPQDRAKAVKIFEQAENQGEQQAAFFARWLRNPRNCLGYRDDQEREKFAGVCSDPIGLIFKSSRERTAWLAETMSKVKVDFFGSGSSYEAGACSAIGASYYGGNCHGHGGVLIDPYSNSDRYGTPQW